MILSWLHSRFDEVIMASNDEEAKVNCPFCEGRIGAEDDGKHLYVNVDEPKAHCFRCEWSGNWYDLIIQASDTSYAEALYLLESAKPRITKWSMKKLVIKKVPHNGSPLGFKSLVGGPKHDWDMEMRACWNYLMKRIKPELVDYRVGSISDTNRVWFLVDDGYWTGRAIINIEPRYLNPNAKKAGTLWNWQCLKPGADITITEGIFGAYAVGPNAVALLGKSITMEQASRIVKSEPKCITIMLDKGCTHESLQVDRLLRLAGIGRTEVKIFWLDQPQPTDSLEGNTTQCTWHTVIDLRWIHGH
jgi:hypothetical protein